MTVSRRLRRCWIRTRNLLVRYVWAVTSLFGTTVYLQWRSNASTTEHITVFVTSKQSGYRIADW
jgi:hypothetical protein